MAFDSLKNKISNLVSSETLGEANIESEEEVKPIRQRKEPKPPKEKKPAFIRKVKESTEEIEEKRKEREQRSKKYVKEREPEETSQPEKTSGPVKSSELVDTEGTVEGYKDVLAILGIKEKLDLGLKIKSDTLDYVEFSQTKPIGFDFDEVTNFISHMKYTLYTLEKALAQREKEIAIVASEVKRNEQKMIDKRQEEELARIHSGPTEEERLIEENMELKIEVNDLNRKIREFSRNAKSLEELNKENELLRSENEFLRANAVIPQKSTKQSSGLPDIGGGLPPFGSGLPSIDEEEDDFDNLISKIGGLYDDEQ